MSLTLVLRCLRLLRAIAWLCVGLLVLLSWIPGDWQTRTSVPGQIEHALAYCGTAALVAFAYQEPTRWRLITGFFILAAACEAGQLWVPGRSAQVIDFAASSVGAAAGVFVGRAALTWLVSLVMRPQR